MNKLRSLFLVLALGLLIAPLGFTSNADQLPGFDVDGQEISFYGNIKVRGTPSGHVSVAVDKAFPLGEIYADGVWDVAFHFAPKKSKLRYQNIDLDLEGATVAFTGRRLSVISAERYVVLNLSLEKEVQRNKLFSFDDKPETVRINRGIALGQYQGTTANDEGLWLCGTEGGRCSVLNRTGDARANNSDPLPETNCPSGGKKSTSCSINCGAGQGCSVACGSGSYACCHCTNGCHCI